MTESESVALPLGDTPTEMGWIVGFEPTHNGATTRCLNHLTIPTAFVEATPGFEPGNKGFADLCLTTWLCRQFYLLGWVVGFEPTYTGATTLGLNHLTIPTI